MTEQGRWTREPSGQGDDPAEVDAEQYDEEHVRHLEQNRPLVNDQPASGDQGISSDKPGVDAGGYPEDPRTEADTDGPGGVSI
jgi:hypothetical protein